MCVCVCSMLGYDRALRYGTVPGAEVGAGPIWMDNVQCNGTEESLEDCEFNGFGISDCSHSEDILVVCGSKYLWMWFWGRVWGSRCVVNI